jgi:hypothetical protein
MSGLKNANFVDTVLQDLLHRDLIVKMQSVPLTDKVVSSDTAQDEVYSIQLYALKLGFRQIVVFFQTIFSVPIIFL